MAMTARQEITLVARVHLWDVANWPATGAGMVLGKWRRHKFLVEFDKQGRITAAALLRPKPFNRGTSIEELTGRDRRQQVLAFIRGERP